MHPHPRVSRGLIAVAALAWLASARSPQAADPAPVASRGYEDSKAQVRFEVLVTKRNGATVGPQAEVRATLSPGSSIVRFLGAGEPGKPDLCDAGFVPASLPEEHAYFWRLDLTLVTTSPERSTVDLQWTRWKATESGARVEAEENERLDLAPGENRIVDYLALGPKVSATCSSLVIRLTADPSPQVRPQQPLMFDAWFSYERGNERRWSHTRVEGRSGEPASFRVAPLAWSLAGAAIASDTTPSVKVDVSGTILATERPDGLLEISIHAVRGITWGRARVEGRGQQRFSCAIGETAAIVFPSAGGRAISRTPLEGFLSLAKGVDSRADTVAIDFERFFDSSQMALYVVVSRGR